MSTDRNRGFVVAAAVAVLVLLPPALARADQRSIARMHFQLGSKHFAAGRFAAARTEFESAYRALPDTRFLANTAACFAAEQRPVEAVRTYRRFLSGAGPGVPASMRRRVDAEIRRLKRAAGDVVLAVEPHGAAIRIDGELIGTAPLPWPVAVRPGARRIEIRAPGYGSLARRIDVERGQQVAVTIVLAPRGPEAITSSSAEYGAGGTFRVQSRPEGRSRGLRQALLWAGAGLTAALAVGAGVTGVLTLRGQSDFEDPATSRARRRELYDRTRGLALVTDILIDAAAITALATLGLFVFGAHDAPAERVRAGAVHLSPRLAARGMRCDLSLVF